MSTPINFTITANTSYFDTLETSSWASPSFAEFDLRDCATITDYWGDLVNLGIKDEPGYSGIGDLDKLRSFLESSLPQDWEPPPTELHLISWYIYVHNVIELGTASEWDSFFYRVEEKLSECKVELCKDLDVRGDPDVSGPGMMGSYYIVASLSTLYFFVLTMFGNRSAIKKKPGSSKTNKVMSAFSDTVGTFLDAALLFAASILISAVLRYGLFVRYMNAGNIDPDDFSSYRLVAAIAMSVYCVFPCIVLQTVAGDLRLRWLRLSLWTIVVTLTIAAQVLYRHQYEGTFWSAINNSGDAGIHTPGADREALWLRLCDDQALLDRIKASVKVGGIILGVECAWLLYYIVANAFIKFGGKDVSDEMKEREVFGLKTRKWLIWARRVNGLLCGSMMWVLLVLFSLYRNNLRVGSKANEDGRWSFGQSLSLLTWAPVILEWLAISISGSKKGQEQKIATGWELQRTDGEKPAEDISLYDRLGVDR